jgi:hypothetical protein
VQIPLIDRAGITMRRLPMHNKRTSSLTVKENLMPSVPVFQTPPLAAEIQVRLAHSASNGILWYTQFRIHQGITQ